MYLMKLWLKTSYTQRRKQISRYRKQSESQTRWTQRNPQQDKDKDNGASLVTQWLRVCLLMQGTRVRALVWEDPTCHGATRPVSHNCWACASGACALQQERPRWWEARAPRWRVAPARRNWRKPSHRNEDPTQPKINKLINLKKKR